MTNIREEYREVFRSLSRVDLQKGASGLEDLGTVDLFDYGTDLWLGFYTQEGIEIALERYGITEDVLDRGFGGLRVDVQVDDPEEHMLRIWGEKPECDEPLIELVVSRDILHLEDMLSDAVGHPFAPVLTVEWLMMQNPNADFAPGRMPLPGQQHPGLGVGFKVMEILRNVCLRLDLAGLITVPAYFHNAAMYSTEFKYLDSDYEAVLQALLRDLLPELKGSLPAASWAIKWKMVVDKLADREEPFEWFHEAMLCPVSDPFKAYFNSDEYRDSVREQAHNHRFRVFTDALEETLEAKGIQPFDLERIEEWIDMEA
ncbi:MAG: hypothetical protein ACQEVA_07435 [Myxococcota bacterium]